MCRTIKSLLSLSCVVTLLGLGSARTAADPFALAEFDLLTATVSDDGGGLEHLSAKWGFCEKEAFAEEKHDHKPRKLFEPLPQDDHRHASAYAAHSSAFAWDTGLFPDKLVLFDHRARAQGKV